MMVRRQIDSVRSTAPKPYAYKENALFCTGDCDFILTNPFLSKKAMQFNMKIVLKEVIIDNIA